MSSGTQVEVTYRYQAGSLLQVKVSFGTGERISVIPHASPSHPFEVAWWRSDGEPRWLETWMDGGQACKGMSTRILSRSDLAELVETLGRGEIPATSRLRPDC